MNIPSAVPVAIQLTAWATPAEDLLLDDLILELKSLGHNIVEVDRVNNRVKIIETTEKV